MRKSTRWVAVMAMALSFLTPAAAAAYGGPGSVISGFGALLAVLVAVLASIFGFLWFPLKKAFRRLRGAPSGADEPAVAERSEEAVHHSS